jgi:hypothetical protein
VVEREWEVDPHCKTMSSGHKQKTRQPTFVIDALARMMLLDDIINMRDSARYK